MVTHICGNCGKAFTDGKTESDDVTALCGGECRDEYAAKGAAAQDSQDSHALAPSIRRG